MPERTGESIDMMTRRTSRLLRQATGGDDNNRHPVFLLMSGGVDSTAALLIALRANLPVIGVTMRHLQDDGAVRAAMEIASVLGIEHRVYDLRSDFTSLVVDAFRSAYLSGRTPNPCTLCNRAIKFGLLYERIAQDCGTEDFWVMTGHYARAIRSGGETHLCAAADLGKDQSYFLCMVPKGRIDRLLLPLGDYAKAQARGVVRELGACSPLLLRVSEKPESMEICFQGEGDYRARLADCKASGPIEDKAGRQLGLHSGYWNFTLGQRKGLGLTSPEPLYVVEIRPETNTVVVSNRDEAFTRSVRAASLNVLAPDAIQSGASLLGKIRSQAPAAPCTLSLTGEDACEALFDEAQFAPAPGQYLALYDGDRLAAGGVIV